MNSQKLLSKNDIKSFTQANRIAITNVIVTDSSYVELDDTAVSSSGGYLKLIGYGFLPGATIYLNGSPVSNTFISSGEYRVVVPAIAPSTVNLMMFNNNNSGAIYTNGVTTSGFPSFTSTTYLTVGTTISVQLLATGDAPLTYSLYSGTLPDGLTLSSSGLISGTVSVSSVTALTVLVNDGQNQTTQQNITLTITVNDPYYPYTTLSLTGESTSNSAFDDASNNRFFLTKNGTPTASAYTPLANTWSWYVNTSTYYTTTSSANFGFSGQFTMEGWLYWIVPPSGDMNVWGVGASNGMLLYYSGGVYRANKYFVGDLVTTSYTPQSNTWHHVAITRDASNLMTVWINGFSAGTATVTGTFATGSWRLGDSRSNDSGGYMSNHRVVNGTCLYTANFTPPTSPLTAINNTVLLVANSNRFVDTSASPFTITQTGSVLLTNTIAPPLSLSDNQSMGSVYFDGTGYLGIATSSAFEFGTGDFTVEFWFYTSANSGLNGNSARTAALITNYGLPSAVRGWSVNLVGDASTTGTAIQFGNAINSSTEYFITYTATIAKGQWYHCAVVRSGTTTSIYLNGTSVASGTLTNQSITSSNQLRIGALDYSAAFYHRFGGFISNLRIVKGQALYTANFTPSTTSLTTTSQSANSANVSLLTAQTKYSGNNDIFYDSSNNKLSLTRVGSVAPSTFTPYSYTVSANSTNTWSTYFDSGGDYVTVPANTNFAFGTGDFTIETWMYTIGTFTGANCRIISTRNSGGGLAGTWSLKFSNTSLHFAEVTTGEPGVNKTGLVLPNSWIHLAVTRQSSNTRLFLNGNLVANGIQSTNFSSTANPVYIGQENGGTNSSINGHLSNLRIVKGQALYTANFTPSTAPLTTTSQGANAANVSLLTFQGNRLVDNSPNAYTITPTGNYSVSKFSPFTKLAEYDSSYYSGSYFFDGTGDYLTVPINSFLAPVNTYTIECWIFPTALPGSTNSAQLFQVSNTNATNFGALLFELYGTGNIRFQVRPSTGGTNVLITSSSTVTTNTWSHVAVSVSSGSATVYINGASVGTGTVVVLNNTQTFSSIGYLTNGFTTNVVAYTGYITDLHVVKGTALYPSAFTPPTTPITPVANTTLLLGATSANASGIIDETMMSSIDVLGAARASTSQKKFGNSAIYFNGTGDILRLQNNGNQQFTFGNSDFTIDGWLYTSTVAAGFRTICTTRLTSAATDTFRFSFGLRAAALEFYAGSAAVISFGTVTGNTWTHFAATRSSGSLRLFLNGTQVGSTTAFTNYLASDQQLTVGGTVALQDLWNGYLDELRVTKGYARYVANFTAPTSPNLNV